MTKPKTKTRKPGGGRKPLEGKSATDSIKLRCTPERKRELERAAKRAGLSLTQWAFAAFDTYLTRTK